MQENEAVKAINAIVAEVMEYYTEETPEFFKGVICAIEAISYSAMEGKKNA